MRTTICVIFAILLCAQGATSPRVTSDHPTYDVTHVTSQETIDSLLHNLTSQAEKSGHNVRVVNDSLYHIHLGNKTVRYDFELTVQPAEQEIENIAHLSITLDPFNNLHLLSTDFNSGKTIVKANPEYSLPYIVDFKNVTNPDRLSLISEVKGNATNAFDLERKHVHSYIPDHVTNATFHTVSNVLASVSIHDVSFNYNFITKISVTPTRTLYTIYTEVEVPLSDHAPWAGHRGTRTEHF